MGPSSDGPMSKLAPGLPESGFAEVLWVCALGEVKFETGLDAVSPIEINDPPPTELPSTDEDSFPSHCLCRRDRSNLWANVCRGDFAGVDMI